MPPVVDRSSAQSDPLVVWVSISPSLYTLDRPLLSQLHQTIPVVSWRYQQEPDEGNSFARALMSLDEYIRGLAHPVHLIGHSMSGVLGLLYARICPERIQSLSLLSVGESPTVDWQAEYYSRLQLLSCGQEFVLGQMVREMFGRQRRPIASVLKRLLQQDLERALSPHSLWKVDFLNPGGVTVPLFVAGGRDDTVVPANALRGWMRWFKQGDRLWECPRGRHFFHRFYPHLLEDELLRFWQELSPIGRGT
ncbi:MAG: alpha/beta fold hydrolase [Synechococcus sp.]